MVQDNTPVESLGQVVYEEPAPSDMHYERPGKVFGVPGGGGGYETTRERTLAAVIPLQPGQWADKITQLATDELAADLLIGPNGRMPGEARKGVYGLAPNVPPTSEEMLDMHPWEVPADQDPLRNEKVFRDKMTAALRQTFEEQNLSLADLLPYRVKAAWRLVRDLARIQKLIAEDETLAEGLAPGKGNEDPWHISAGAMPEFHNNESVYIKQNLIDVFYRSLSLSQDLCYWRHDFANNQRLVFPGIAVLPPIVPLKWTTEGDDITDEYDPQEDEGLCLYVRALQVLARRLYIDQGSQKDPAMGRYGLLGLLDPQTIRLCFPSRLHIVAWEEIVIEEALELLVKCGVRGASRELQYRYGLAKHEIESLLKMARVQARKALEGDLEEDRGLMLLRIEDYVKRCQDALDTRAELAGLKQMSQVLGLSKADPEDQLTDFIKIVKNVTDSRKKLPSQKTLPFIDAKMIDTKTKLV